MPDKFRYDYAVIRVVPKVDREEFINAGVIVSCPELSFLEARIKLDESRLLALDHLAGRCPHFGFHTASADGACDRAVFAHQ